MVRSFGQLAPTCRPAARAREPAPWADLHPAHGGLAPASGVDDVSDIDRFVEETKRA
jgi:hypothetical protein